MAAAAAPPPPPVRAEGVEPSPSDVAQLIGMGFDRQMAVDALRASGGDLTAATNRLLD